MPALLVFGIFLITLAISIPIARRSIGDYQSGSSSGSASLRDCAFPYKRTVTSCNRPHPYGGGTAPVSHRTSLLGHRHLTSYTLFRKNYIIPLFQCQRQAPL